MTTDAVKILRRRYVTDAKRSMAVEVLRFNEEASALLRQMRRDKHLTQQELSALTGLTQSVISRMESASHGRTIKNMAKVAGALGVKIRLSLEAVQ